MTDKTPPDYSTLADDLLRMEEIESDTFRSDWHFGNAMGANFGGQMFGQAMAAAVRTRPDWPVHYMSGGFVRPGRGNMPIDYHVTRLRDGRSFSTRRVSAMQDGNTIFEALASFHSPEDGPEHQVDMREGTLGPDDLIDLSDFIAANSDRIANPQVASFLNEWPFDIRLTDNESLLGAHRGEGHDFDYWARIRPAALASARAGDAQSLFGFLSDFWFAGTALRRHAQPFAGGFQNSTLNHSVWFHAPFDMDDWLLFQVDSPVAGDVRGMTRGLVYDRNGRLVASAAQELLIRPI